MSIWDKNIKDFRDDLASAAPTPGGGSAAMVVAAFGAALVSMAVEVSIKRAEHARELDVLPAELKQLMDALSADADEDEAAFRAYMAARDSSGGEMAAAKKRAAEAPIQGMRHIIATLKIAADAAPLVAESIVSDVGAGASLLDAAMEAALMTADMNLAGMKEDPKEQAAYAATLKELGERALVLRDSVRKSVLARI